MSVEQEVESVDLKRERIRGVRDLKNEAINCMESIEMKKEIRGIQGNISTVQYDHGMFFNDQSKESVAEQDIPVSQQELALLKNLLPFGFV